MKRTMIWGLMVLMGVALGVGDASARSKGGYKNEDKRPRVERRADRLDLGEEQREQIESIHEAARDEVAGLRKSMLRLRHDIRGEMLEDDPDAGKLRRLAEQMGEIRTQLQIHRLETRLAVRGVLTPDQRDRMLLGSGRNGAGGFDRESARCWGAPAAPAGPAGPARPAGPAGPAPRSGRGCRSAYHSGRGVGPGPEFGCGVGPGPELGRGGGPGDNLGRGRGHGSGYGSGHGPGPGRGYSSGHGWWRWEGNDDDSTSVED